MIKRSNSVLYYVISPKIFLSQVFIKSLSQFNCLTHLMLHRKVN